MNDTITLQGKEYPIAYNMYRLGVFFRKKKLTLQDGMAALDSDLVLMFEILTDMLNVGAKKAGKKVNYRVETVGDMVGPDIEVIGEALASFLPDVDEEDEGDEGKQAEAVGQAEKKK